jgi:hypothetical protein
VARLVKIAKANVTVSMAANVLISMEFAIACLDGRENIVKNHASMAPGDLNVNIVVHVLMEENVDLQTVNAFVHQVKFLLI